MSTARIIAAIVLAILMAQSTTALDIRPRQEFQDFSRLGPDYEALTDLRIRGYNAIASGIRTVPVLGETLSLSRYVIRSTVTVQTLCAIGTPSIEEYQQVPIALDVFIADDVELKIHDRLVGTIHSAWSAGDYNADGLYFDFAHNSNAYALVARPTRPAAEDFVVLWVNGRVALIRIDHYVGGRDVGWGALDSFTEDNLAVVLEGKALQLGRFEDRDRKAFLKLYSGGHVRPRARSN